MQPIGAEGIVITARNADHRMPSGLPFKLFRHVGENSSCTKKEAPALEARKILYLQLIKTLRVGAEIKESMTRHVSETRVEGPLL